MPAFGHLAVGLAAARAVAPPARLRPAAWWVLLVAVSHAPDLDVAAFALGIPYGAPWGHRGAAHSPVFALLCGVVAAGIARGFWKEAFWRVLLVVSLVMASHGVLDAFTDGGRGIALAWPWSDERYFAPVRPIPVAPIGVRLLSSRGASVVAHELILFAPLVVYALWPRRRPARRPPPAGV